MSRKFFAIEPLDDGCVLGKKAIGKNACWYVRMYKLDRSISDAQGRYEQGHAYGNAKPRRSMQLLPGKPSLSLSPRLKASLAGIMTLSLTPIFLSD